MTIRHVIDIIENYIAIKGIGADADTHELREALEMALCIVKLKEKEQEKKK